MRGAGWDQSWDQSNASLDSLKRSWIQILRAQSIFLLRCGIPSSSSSVLRKWQRRGRCSRCHYPTSASPQPLQ